MLAAFMVAVLTGVTLGGVWFGSAVAGRHRAQAAADLAALAAAGRVAGGPALACREAASLAAAMDATLESCALDGLDIAVAVRVEHAAPTGGAARARARAGPV